MNSSGQKPPFSVSRKIIAWFFILLTLHYISSCTYFRVKDSTPAELEAMLENTKFEQTFVLHYGNRVFLLENYDLSETALKGNVTEVAGSGYSKALLYNDFRKKRYSSAEKEIVNQVHIYLNDQFEIGNGDLTIPLESINEIRIIDKNIGKTILAISATIVGLYVLLIIIILLTKSSCPYIYSHDGGSYVFEGEIFGGAILKNLERDDYMPLPSIRHTDNAYKLIISNELKEKQFIDLANLLLVDHPEGTRVLLDQQGKPRLISDSLSLTAAETPGERPVLEEISLRDSKSYQFDDEGLINNHLILEFDRNTSTDSVNLVINARNTLWFDYVMGEFFTKFGSSFDTWMDGQREMSTKERIRKIEERNIPLSISVLKNGNWQLVDRIPTVGPLAYREMVIPIDVSDILGDAIRVKIATGYMFWEIDQVMMSSAGSASLKVQTLKPTQALDHAQQKFTSALTSADGHYLDQLNTGDQVEITFNAPVISGSSNRSVFLHTKGYYELVRDFEHTIQLSDLQKFKEPSYLAEYAMVRYKDFVAASENFIAKN